ncbi:hypothetical protein ALT761_03578 [Alteromonas sp. 76-1]|jgi:hypothetical protein|nr:hypothetical protein ALT761_03578 [Alteromonas sp. 76-1]
MMGDERIHKGVKGRSKGRKIDRKVMYFTYIKHITDNQLLEHGAS